MSTVEYIKKPVYSSEDGKTIDCVIKFSTVDIELPFTASIDDNEPHGVEIYKSIVNGDAGLIGVYVPKVIVNTIKTDAAGSGNNSGPKVI